MTSLVTPLSTSLAPTSGPLGPVSFPTVPGEAWAEGRFVSCRAYPGPYPGRKQVAALRKPSPPSPRLNPTGTLRLGRWLRGRWLGAPTDTQMMWGSGRETQGPPALPPTEEGRAAVSNWCHPTKGLGLCSRQKPQWVPTEVPGRGPNW